MSGTTSLITAEAGLFRNYTVDPTTVTDLQTAITTAITTAAGATASAAAAEADAATATTAATNAQSASTSAIAAVNAAASTAETTINAAVSSASTYASQASASATAAANSATAANTSATTAAAAVATSATNAASSATAAASSASAAANSATTAGTNATSAAGSVTAAAASASAASTSATNAQTSATNAAASAVSAGGIFGQTIGRNYVQNSRFQVQQRGTGPWTSTNFTADRWYIQIAGDTSSASVQVPNDASRAQIGDEAARYSLNTTFTGAAAAGDFTFLSHSMEDATRLSNKTVTVSFYASAATAATLVGVSLLQYFGTGGSPSASVYVTPQVVSVGTSWTRFSVTFVVPSTAGKSFGTTSGSLTQIRFAFSSGSTNAASLGVGVQSGTIALYGVQLEVGTTTTALEVKSYDYDLRECQRFYQTVQATAIGVATGTAQIIDGPVFWQTMRTTPTVITLGPGTFSNVSSTVFYAGTFNSGRFEITSSAAGQCVAYGYPYGLSADI
jgi:hypothetical protein